MKKILLASALAFSTTTNAEIPTTGPANGAILGTTSVRVINEPSNTTSDFTNCTINNILFHHESNTNEQNTVDMTCYNREDTVGWTPLIPSGDLYIGHIWIDDFHVGYPEYQCRMFSDDTTTYYNSHGNKLNHRHMVYKCKVWPN